MQLNNLFRIIPSRYPAILSRGLSFKRMQVAAEREGKKWKKGWWTQKASEAIIKEHVITVKQESRLIACFRFTKVSYVATR